MAMNLLPGTRKVKALTKSEKSMCLPKPVAIRDENLDVVAYQCPCCDLTVAKELGRQFAMETIYAHQMEAN